MKAGAAGGIEAVVKAINTHIKNPSVCQQGCSALWSMTLNGNNSKSIKASQKMNSREPNESRSSRRD